jgi:hypothetical protein
MVTLHGAVAAGDLGRPTRRYISSCRVLTLKLAGGTTHEAYFKLTK